MFGALKVLCMLSVCCAMCAVSCVAHGEFAFALSWCCINFPDCLGIVCAIALSYAGAMHALLAECACVLVLRVAGL